MMLALRRFLARPGVQASEFKVALAVTAWLGVNASEHWQSALHALIESLPALLYVVSRGLAKYETRVESPPPAPPVPPVPPAGAS